MRQATELRSVPQAGQPDLGDNIMREVRSPAGEPITVLSDSAYAELADVTEYSLRAWGDKAPVLASLWEHGAYTDPSGQATRRLWEDAQARGYGANMTAITSLWNAPVNRTAVDRDVKGRRCYRLQLVALPERWLDRLTATNGHKPAAPSPQVTHFAPELEAPPEVVEEQTAEDWLRQESPEVVEELETPPEAPSEPAQDDVLELRIAQTVATELLARVVEIVSTGGTDETAMRLRAERDDARERLYAATELAERNRRQLRETGDELRAVKDERDSLRRRLRATEENLQRAMTADVDGVVRDRVQAELAKVMRAVPTTKGPE